MISLLLAVACLQDHGKVTLEKSAPIDVLVAEIAKATGGNVKVSPDADKKDVRIVLKEAGFFQALDAVCRAHGGVTYIDKNYGGPSGLVLVREGAWLEYPSIDSGPFRVLVSEIGRFTQSSSVGERAWSRVFLVLLGPPWIGVSEQAGAEGEFVVEEALDADGKDVRLPAGEPELVVRAELLGHANLANYGQSNSARKTIMLKPFDPDRGLSVLRGKAVLKVADSVATPIVPKVGERVDTDAGTLIVDKVSEHSKKDQKSTWRIQLTMKPKDPKAPLRRLIEQRLFWGEEDWNELDLPKDRHTFEAVVKSVPELPATLTFVIRRNARSVEVPFDLRKLTFRKD